jgi:hypothetical protein
LFLQEGNQINSKLNNINLRISKLTNKTNKMKSKLWTNIKEGLENNIINKEILRKFIYNFYETIVEKIDSDQHILFLFRIELENDDIKTCTKLLKINNSGKENLTNYLIDAINLTNENYNNTPIKAIIISYGVRKGVITPTIPFKEETKFHHVYYNHKLPLALKPEEYGDVIDSTGGKSIINLKRNTVLIIESTCNNQYKIKYFKNGKLMYEWTDYIKEDGSLIREIGKTTILWKDNEII